MWNLEKGTNRMLRKKSAQMARLDASVDGKRLFVQLPKSIECWDIADGKRIWESRDGGSLKGAAPDGLALLVHLGGEARLQLLDPATGKTQPKLKQPPWRGNWVSKWGADSRTLLIPDADRNTLLVWDLVTGKERARFPGWNQSVMAPDGKSILVAEMCLQRWDLQTMKPLYPSVAERGHSYAPADLACSQDSKVLVSADPNGDLWFWDLQTSRLIRVVREMNCAGLAFTPDGRQLIAGTSDKTLLVCDAKSGKVLRRWKLEDLPKDYLGIGAITICEGNKLIVHQYNSIAVSGRAVLGGAGPGGVIGEWNIETGKRQWFRTVEGAEVFCGLSRDGRLGIDWNMRLRELESGRLIGRLAEKEEHGSVGANGTFSPDGSLIVTQAYRSPKMERFSDDWKYSGIEVWERVTRRLLRRITVADWPRSFVFAPDGRRLAIHRDDELWIWDVIRGKELLHLKSPGNVPSCAFLRWLSCRTVGPWSWQPRTAVSFSSRFHR